MTRTLHALEDLSAIDRQLRTGAPPKGAAAGALEERRAALREAVPEPFLASYDALTKMNRRPAVVPVRNAHCGGCYLRLPPQLDAAIRHRSSLHTCPHCHRLLYMPAPPESADAGAPRPEPERAPARRPSSKRAKRPARRRPSGERRLRATEQELRPV